MQLNRLKEQLAELKRKETIAQTREQLLIEEKQKLLTDIDSLLLKVKELGVVPVEQLTSTNLQGVVDILKKYIEEEVKKSNIPMELS